jgi:transcriptional regulator with XRE-family HTH domain
MANGFGKKLKELREAKGLSQEGLARAAGISVSSVSKLEQQKGESGQDPAWSTIQALARALGVTCEAFADCEDMKGEEEKPATKKPTTKKGKK